MQNLQADLAIVPMHRFGDALQFPSLRMLGQDRPAGLDQAGGVWRVAAGNNERDLAFGPLGKKHRHLVQPVFLHIEPGVHRTHDHPVAQRGSSHLQGRQQVRIERCPRIGLHGVAPWPALRIF
jgi:hypothetical protein